MTDSDKKAKKDTGDLPLVTDASELEHPDADDGDQAEAPAPEGDDE